MKRAQSYSSISTYKKCPKLWAWTYVLGNRGPDSPSAARGTELHLRLEEFFRGAPYPTANKVLAPWQRFMEALTVYNPSPEGELAVDAEWNPVGFEDHNAYARGKVDLLVTQGKTRIIYDWKSGREYPDHPSQGKMYLAIETGDYNDYFTQFVYLDSPLHVVPHHYSPAERAWEIIVLKEVIERINADTEYVATPSQSSCQYCPISWRKGGECRRAP